MNPKTDPTPIDTYFAATSHPASSIWLAFSDNLKSASLAHATRQITAYCAGSIPNDGATPTPAIEQNYQYAIFEQALHVAKSCGAALDFDTNRPAFIPPDAGEVANGTGSAGASSVNSICEAALSWMNGLGGGGRRIRVQAEIVRA